MRDNHYDGVTFMQGPALDAALLKKGLAGPPPWVGVPVLVARHGGPEVLDADFDKLVAGHGYILDRDYSQGDAVEYSLAKDGVSTPVVIQDGGRYVGFIDKSSIYDPEAAAGLSDADYLAAKAE